MTHLQLRAGVIAALAATCFAATAHAATPAPAAGASAAAAANLSAGDKRFVEKAAMSGLAEATLGRLATERASHADVKAFGNMMVQDHDKANAELGRIATAKGMAVPTELDRAHQRKAEKLGKLSGAEFDKEFMKEMVSAHKDAVSDFEKASKSVDDADLKGFATRTLPTLQTHLEHAKTTHDQVKNAR